jgi:hypothetical protein
MSFRLPHPNPLQGKKTTEELKKQEMEGTALKKVLAALEDSKPARSVSLTEEEAEMGEPPSGWAGGGGEATKSRTGFMPGMKKGSSANAHTPHSLCLQQRPCS